MFILQDPGRPGPDNPIRIEASSTVPWWVARVVVAGGNGAELLQFADAALDGVAFLVAYGVKGARPGVVESGLGTGGSREDCPDSRTWS